VAASVKKAVIVGSEGQDGSLLRELLERKKYEVLRVNRGGNLNVGNFNDVRAAVKEFKPNEVYYLAAFHHSSEDARQEELELFTKSFEVNTQGLIHFLEAIRLESPKTRLFYASSSHVFGSVVKSPQDESTPLNPENIYGISKATGMMICRYYRKIHSIFASTGILYNHESPLRADRFVSKKIAKGVARIQSGEANELILGDLDSKVDWGYAPDYVEAMRRILATKKADDFVISTGKPHRVGDFAKIAFARANLPTKGRLKTKGKIAKKLPSKLVGNSKKLRRTTGWKPTVSFKEMVEILVDSELK